MRRDWNKIISLLCAAVFLLGLCRDYAVSSLSGVTASSPMPAQSTGQNSVFKMPGVKISASKNYLSDSFVINIQDYHGDYASQLAICGILEKIAASGKKTEIYVEGAYREVDLSYLKEIKSAPAFEAFVQMLLKNGKLTGAEFFALKNPGVRLNGLEDLDLYMRNLKNLSRLIDGRENILSGFEVYSDKIAGKILASLNPENKKLYSLKQKYEKDKIKHEKYCSFVLKHASAAGIEIQKTYPDLYGYCMSDDLKSKINFKKTETDMSVFLSFVKKTLSYKDYSLIDKSGNKPGMLAEIYRDYSFKTPELTKFFAYLDCKNKINPSLLLEQEDSLLWNTMEACSGSSVEKQGVRSLRALEYARKLLLGEIVPYEYGYLLKNEVLFENSFNKYLGMSLSAEIKAYYEASKEFYEINEKRNEVFIKKAAVEKNSGQSRSVNGIEGSFDKASSVKVLITGGYHSKGLSAILESFRSAYAVLTPEITSSDDNVKSAYENSIKIQAASAFSAFQKFLNFGNIIVNENGFNIKKFCDIMLDYDTVNFFVSQKAEGNDISGQFCEGIVKMANNFTSGGGKIRSLSFEISRKEKNSYEIEVRVETESGAAVSEVYAIHGGKKKSAVKRVFPATALLKSAGRKLKLSESKQVKNFLFERYRSRLAASVKKFEARLAFCRANPDRRELEIIAPEILKTAAEFTEAVKALDRIYPDLDYVRQAEGERLIAAAFGGFAEIISGEFDFGAHNGNFSKTFERVKKTVKEFGLEAYENIPEKLRSAVSKTSSPSPKKTTKEIENNIMRYFAGKAGSSEPVFAFAVAGAKESLGGEYDYDAADMTFKRISAGFFRKQSIKRAGGRENIVDALNRQSREIMPYFKARAFAVKDQEETEDALIRSLSALEILAAYPDFADMDEIIKISLELFEAAGENIDIKTSEKAYLDALAEDKEKAFSFFKKEMEDKIEYARRVTVFQNELIKVIALIGKRNPAYFGQARDFLLKVSDGSILQGRGGMEGMYWLRQQSILRLKDFNSPAAADALNKIMEAEDKTGFSSPDSVFMSVNLESSNSKTLSLKLHAAGVLIDFNRQNARALLEKDAEAYFRSLQTVPAKERFAYILAAADFISDPVKALDEKAGVLKGFSLIKDKDILFAANILLDLIVPAFGEISPQDSSVPVVAGFLASFASALSAVTGKELLHIKYNADSLKNQGYYFAKTLSVILSDIRFELGNMGSGNVKPSGWISGYNVFMISGGGATEEIVRLKNLNFSGRIAGLMSANDDGGSSLLCRGRNARVNGIYSLSQGDVVNFMTSAAALKDSDAPLKNILGGLMNTRFQKDISLSAALAQIKASCKQKAGESLIAEFERFWSRLEKYARICDEASIPIINNSLKNLIFEAIALDNMAYGEGFVNPDGVYSSMKDFADLLGTRSVALSALPYGNIIKVKTKGGIEFIGQSYFSHTPHIVSGGKTRTFWTPETVGAVFDEISAQSRVAQSISGARVIIAGLCSWITSLGIQLCDKDVSEALALNEKADKILITNPVKDDENTMSWSESAVAFLQRISKRKIHEMFNNIFAWQTAARDKPSGFSALTEKEIFDGAAGGYLGENAVSVSGTRLVDKHKIKLHVISGGVNIKQVPRRDDPSGVNYKIASDPQVVAENILSALSRANSDMVYGNSALSVNKNIRSSAMDNATALLFAAENVSAENRADSLLEFGVSSFVFIPVSSAEMERKKLAGEASALQNYSGISYPSGARGERDLCFFVDKTANASVTKCYYAAENAEEAGSAVEELALWFKYELPSLAEAGLVRHDQLFMVESSVRDIGFEKLDLGASTLKVLIGGTPSSRYDLNINPQEAADSQQYINALLNEMRKPVNSIARRLSLYNNLNISGYDKDESLLSELKELLVSIDAWDDKAKRAAVLYALKSGFEIKVSKNSVRFTNAAGKEMPFYIDAAGRFVMAQKMLEKMRFLEKLRIFADMDDNIAHREKPFTPEMQNIFAVLTLYGICSPVVITGNTDKTLWVRFKSLPETVLKEMEFYTEVGGLRYEYVPGSGFVEDPDYTYERMRTAIPKDMRQEIRELTNNVDSRFDDLFISFVRAVHGLENYNDAVAKALENYPENGEMMKLIKKITGQSSKNLLMLYWKDLRVKDVQKVLDELAAAYNDENAAVRNGLSVTLKEENYLKALEIVSLLEYCRISFSERAEDGNNKQVLTKKSDIERILQGTYKKHEADSTVRVSLTPIRVKHVKAAISELYARKFASIPHLSGYKVESSGRTTINIMKEICQKTLPVEDAIDNIKIPAENIVYSGDEVFLEGMSEADSGIDDSIARLDLKRGRKMLVVSTNPALHNTQARPNLISISEVMRRNGIPADSPVDAGTFLHKRILERLEYNFEKIMTEEDFEPENIIQDFKKALENGFADYPVKDFNPSRRQLQDKPVSVRTVSDMLGAA